MLPLRAVRVYLFKLTRSERWLSLWSSYIGRLRKAHGLRETGPLVAAGGVASLLVCLARVFCLPLSLDTVGYFRGTLLAPYSFKKGRGWWPEGPQGDFRAIKDSVLSMGVSLWFATLDPELTDCHPLLCRILA